MGKLFDTITDVILDTMHSQVHQTNTSQNLYIWQISITYSCFKEPTWTKAFISKDYCPFDDGLV